MNFIELKLAVKEVLINMAIEAELPSDMNELDISGVFEKALNGEKLVVHTGVVSHKQGTAVFVATTKEGLDKKIAEYCKDNWDECENQDELTGDETDQEIIEMYFDTEHGNISEFLEHLGESEI